MIKSALLLFSVSLIAGCGHLNRATSQEPTSCASNWRMIYIHDTNGLPLAGKKSALLDAVRSGAPIRVAWGARIERKGNVASVEHTADPVFLTIMSQKEVVIQLPEHIAQKSYFDPAMAAFDTTAVMWRGLMSTDGTFDARMFDRATGKEIRRLPQKVRLVWFALLPPEHCSSQPPVELAVPQGVIAAPRD